MGKGIYINFAYAVEWNNTRWGQWKVHRTKVEHFNNTEEYSDYVENTDNAEEELIENHYDGPLPNNIAKVWIYDVTDA